MSSNSLSVKEFTEAARGIECPKIPEMMNKESVMFLITMVMSEMQELALTVSNSEIESIQLLQNCLSKIDISLHIGDIPYRRDISNIKEIADQSDAMVDAWYYMLDMAAKHGMNLSSVFDIVHQSNMNKRWPDDTFHRREDNKIIKPPGWISPDIYSEILRQSEQGSWI